MDEAIDHFVAFTGASADVARRYLALTENSEQAIQLFFESPDLASGLDEPQQAPPIPASTRPQASAPNVAATDDNLIDLSDDGNIDVDGDEDEAANAAAIAKAAEVEDDEAMARRMQQELYAGGDASAGFDADGVRAPIGRRTETLVGGPDGDGNWGSDDMQLAVMEQMRARQRARPSRLGVFNQAPVSSIWGEAAEPQQRREGLARATGGASESSPKAQRLAELFRPPFELMHQVPFDVAREKAKDELKWILVNVQDTSIFDCQQLNRDIWKHDGIKELVKENFIFVQYSKDDPRGSGYIQYYFQMKDSDAAYPHIAIVDPRTGEQVKAWSGRPVPIPGVFLMELVEFLDRYSLDLTKKNPVAKRKPEKAKSIDVARLTEEEMLDLALQNSLANSGSAGPSGPKHDDPDDLTKSFGDISKGKGKEAEDAEEAHISNGSAIPPPSNSTFTAIPSNHPHEEPPMGPGVTRIQFRHSNGRIVRRFNQSDPVARIFEWLKAAPLEGKEGTEFELKGMGKNLIDYLEETIQEAGLNNGTVMVEFED